MSAYIYIEGGAKGPDSKGLRIRCQQAFHTLLDRMGFTGRKPRLVACGGRGAVYERFCTEHASQSGAFVAMWIDSEEPLAGTLLLKDMDKAGKAWEHLAKRDNWDTPVGAVDGQVLFMTTCMETWIVADRATLREHYKKGYQESQLPPLAKLETRSRQAVQGCLEQATAKCSNAYAKGARSYELLGKLDPDALRMLPSFVRVESILKKRL